MLLMILMPLMASADDDNVVRGDINGDGVVNMADVMFIINYIKNGKYPDTVMPELRISFEGTLSRDMEDYLNGSMQLTDANGNVVELPAGFKTRGATAKKYSMKPALNMKLFTEDYTEEADSSLLKMRSCSSWILDAMAIDRICMRNRVAFDIMYRRQPLTFLYMELKPLKI